MISPVKRLFITAVTATGIAFAPGAGAADDFPKQGPVTLIVPIGAGGGTDAIARVVSNALSKEIGQTIVVNNKAGAAGAIGSQYVARSAPDGYTLLFGGMSSLSVLPALKPSSETGFDIFRDFEPIGIVWSAPNVLVVRSDLPVHNLKEFIDYAKAHPGELKYGSSGVGSVQHLGMEYLKTLAGGLDIMHVPYKSNNEVAAAMLSNVVQALISGMDTALPYIQNGSMRAIALTGEKRSPILPDVQTGVEAGYPSFVIDARCAFLAPKGTPADRLDIIREGLKRALATKEVKDFYAKNGAVAIVPDGPAMTAYYKADHARYREAGKAAGLVQ
jgi:tripartite-type tricarboxylate transporter receptor subunit TctC